MKKPAVTQQGARFRVTSACALVLLFLMAMTGAQSATAAPLAGTSIGNQASATYTDASAVVRTATSNTVQTIVQQVASLSLTSSQTKIVAAGGTVYYPHTLKNTGNGNDTFTLGAVDANSGTINFTTIAIYPDANGDGVPDSFTPITTSGPLGADATFNFIVAATASGASVDGNADTITLTATSGFTPASTASNTDTVNVSGNAIVVMTKSVSHGNGAPGTGPLTYTLTYTNTGNATATALVITDVLPAGVTYNAGNKARWSVSGATALTDAADGVQTFGAYTINYDAATTPGTITATINQVLAGESRTLTFEVNVSGTAPPGIINNTATFGYNDGAGPKTGSTNPTPFTVNQAASVVANGSNASNVDGTAEPVTVASALQGSTVTFNSYIWNTGNGTDSFDITIGASTFPAGTSFVLYKSDGVTPLIDTNSNSTPDTGPLATGASYNVVVKAILPASAVGGPFSATMTATSKLDNSKSNPSTLTLTSITANTVDLTLTTARSDSSPAGTAVVGNAATTGFGAYVVSSAALTPHITANPGTSATFVLKINNTSSTADTYDLAAGTDETFATTPLPGGWTLIFKADASVAKDCSSTGAVISNTGVINSASNGSVCAVLSIPANASAGTQNIYFRALSPTSSASDRLHGAIDINAVRSIIVTNSQTGQVFPGGTVVYPMTITNNGNVTEGTVASAGTPNGTTDSKVTIGLSNSLAAQGWSSVVYQDANNNGAIDPTDPVINDLASIGGLTAGASVPLLVKVFAPAGAGIGNIDTATLTATISGVINGSAAPAASSASATSTVISGQVSLTKLQALDAACDGTADAAFTQANITTGAIPGACIMYQVTAKNVGTASITTLEISDATPANTVYATGCVGSSVAAASTSAGTISQVPSSCSAGTVKATVNTLAPGATAVVLFGVKINP